MCGMHIPGLLTGRLGKCHLWLMRVVGFERALRDNGVHERMLAQCRRTRPFWWCFRNMRLKLPRHQDAFMGAVALTLPGDMCEVGWVFAKGGPPEVPRILELEPGRTPKHGAKSADGFVFFAV